MGNSIKKSMDALLIGEERKKLEKMFQGLNEEGTYIKKLNQALIQKPILLLFPPMAFALTFLKINIDKSINDLLAFIVMGRFFVYGWISLNYLLSKGK